MPGINTESQKEAKKPPPETQKQTSVITKYNRPTDFPEYASTLYQIYLSHMHVLACYITCSSISSHQGDKGGGKLNAQTGLKVD